MNNNISDSGAASIAQAFKRAPTLTSLDLASNKISDRGIEAICEALGERSLLPHIRSLLPHIGSLLTLMRASGGRERDSQWAH